MLISNGKNVCWTYWTCGGNETKFFINLWFHVSLNYNFKQKLNLINKVFTWTWTVELLKLNYKQKLIIKSFKDQNCWTLMSVLLLTVLYKLLYRNYNGCHVQNLA